VRWFESHGHKIPLGYKIRTDSLGNAESPCLCLIERGSGKKRFEKVDVMKRPVYGTFLPATTNSSFHYTPIMGLRVLALCFNLGFSIKKNEA
jgi:hypothetical protein